MKKGFTLFEMIVAIGVFSIIVVITLGSVLTISNSQKKAASFRTVQDNLNFALEMMSKSIRVGYSYHCEWDDVPQADDTIAKYGSEPQDCSIGSGGGNVFVFTNSEGKKTAYRFNFNVNNVNKPRLEVASEETGNVFTPLTSNDVEITQGRFYVKGSEAGNGEQPRLTIILTGAAGRAGKIQSEARLQTTISQRRLDS